MSARKRLAVAFAVLSLAASAMLPSAASAAAVPYSDPNAVGYLGFCDANNHQITSGSIQTQPFVVKTVASTPAPAHYGQPYGRATLYVYQPIQYVDPSNWSGKQLTAATAFSNNKAPMAIGTPLDPSMVNFSSVFPLHVDGFAEVRLYFTAFGQTQYASSYPTANIKISGNTWTQVGGGKIDCKAGEGHSNEVARNAPTTFPTKPAAKDPTRTSRSPSGSTTGSAPASNGAPNSTGADPVNASHNTKSNSNAGLIVLILALVVVFGGGGAYAVLRRRNKVIP